MIVLSIIYFTKLLKKINSHTMKTRAVFDELATIKSSLSLNDILMNGAIQPDLLSKLKLRLREMALIINVNKT